MKNSYVNRFRMFWVFLPALAFIFAGQLVLQAPEAEAAGVYQRIISQEEAQADADAYADGMTGAHDQGYGQTRTGYAQSPASSTGYAPIEEPQGYTEGDFSYREGADYIDLVNPGLKERVSREAADSYSPAAGAYGAQPAYVEDAYDGPYEIVPMEKPKQRYTGPNPSNPRRTILD